jgi:hypothetical protein
MPFETTSAICSISMGGILEKYPQLRLAFAHGKKFIKKKFSGLSFFRWWIISIYNWSY